ncbi:Hypothetical protein SAMN05421831_10343 [Allopseudospirillum japonicum]|uniref:DUF2271 domain-containing protein n=1 Tax=Allopseudospirillum japonicum TaxID=64971 RepID=A0A1H6R6Q8_9GAMM|nr:DUF2271 domain-containing protein [Allopseudospirillum japonicum]SEI50156.1 Hypothetical protein SAMN05421831_10343 [Allopseudospirillum japonicum]
MFTRYLFGILLLIAPISWAQTQQVQVEIALPTLEVAEYHKPYVALWLSDPQQQALATLNLWYDAKMPDKEGMTWLKDLRLWWRRTGRTLQTLDAFTGATRASGVHTLRWPLTQAPWRDLPAGEYILHLEVAREVGGREHVSLPFQWPLHAPLKVQGTHEISHLSLMPSQSTQGN